MRDAFCAVFLGVFAIAGSACSSGSSSGSGSGGSSTSGSGNTVCGGSVPENSSACPAPANGSEIDIVGKSCAPGGVQCFYQRLDDGENGACMGPIEFFCASEDGGTGDASTGTWQSGD